MQQQVQLSPKTPEGDAAQGPLRERKARAQADAAAFGMLLGALRAGEAGIVRGEVRNDSAAEWNAQDAREQQQEPRPGAQDPAARAQERRGGLDRLASEAHRPAPAQSPADQMRAAAGDAEGGETRTNEGPRAAQEAPRPAGDQAPRSERGAAMEPQALQPGSPAAAASITPGSAASAGSAASGRVGVQSSQATAVDASRGPQGGAARGRARSAPAPRADQAFRFEKAFQAQVGRGLAQALRSGDGEVTLRLRPESLGQLSVRVQVRQQQVTATFEARHAEAQRMLEGSREVLRGQLEARGLTVERIEIRLVEDPAQAGTRLATDDNGGADGGQDGQAFAGDRDGRGAPEGDGADDGSRRGASREDDGLAVAGAEPWRVLGTVRLNAIA